MVYIFSTIEALIPKREHDTESNILEAWNTSYLILYVDHFNLIAFTVYDK